MIETTADQAINIVWWTSLALGLVVSVVVAVLLWLIEREARTINSRVGKIWEIGQRIANNTVHIPLLYRTNETAGQILATAGEIEQGARAIKAHAQGCPGCPQCMLTH